MNTQNTPEVRSDFLLAKDLAALTNVPVKTQYNQHSSGTGALAPILTKLGGRLGAWRDDYSAWVAKQRRLVA